MQNNKMSSTLEELGFDRRAYHLLKRASIHHVSSLIVRGRSGILNIKGMGMTTVNHIISVVAKHLGLPENEVFSEKTMQEALIYEEKPFDPLDAPITVLDLPLSTCNTLNSLGVFVMRDLLRLKAEVADGYGIEGLRKTETRRIYAELNLYLSRHNQPNMERKVLETATIPTVINLSTILAATIRDERTLRIIELRAGQLLTLEEIATKTGGVTRERIRQIIDQVNERIRENLNLLKIFCDFFEEIVEDIGRDIDPTSFVIESLVKKCKLYLPGEVLNATEEELRVLMIIIRLLVIYDKPWANEYLYSRWKNFVFLTCMAIPPIKGHDVVNQTLIDNKIKNKKLGYKELAHLILSKEKRPMHWSEVVDHAYRMKRRDSFNSAALYNALSGHPDVFVRVDAGTYALTEWGFNQVDTYPDIIASILKSSKKPLSADAIYHRVNEIRPVKQSTLIMSLDMHPRFYRSLEKTYGLRVWLPPREKQTLRTPEWRVEDSDSYKRLEQASRRGYDIENMIQEDLDDDHL
ncbi:MAG: hypothetical protein KPEEDBHJ_02252 [Anaerolineales bacterium]|nr:hypothetical protein [Anaerolineales bacterium]